MILKILQTKFKKHNKKILHPKPISFILEKQTRLNVQKSMNAIYYIHAFISLDSEKTFDTIKMMTVPENPEIRTWHVQSLEEIVRSSPKDVGSGKGSLKRTLASQET